MSRASKDEGCRFAEEKSLVGKFGYSRKLCKSGWQRRHFWVLFTQRSEVRGPGSQEVFEEPLRPLSGCRGSELVRAFQQSRGRWQVGTQWLTLCLCAWFLPIPGGNTGGVAVSATSVSQTSVKSASDSQIPVNPTPFECSLTECWSGCEWGRNLFQLFC